MFHKNGSLKSEVVYENDKPSTNWIYYDENGKKEKEDVYENGKFFYEKYCFYWNLTYSYAKFYL